MAGDEFAGADWIDRNWERLFAERLFEHEWVAVDAERIVAHDPQLDRVMATLRETRRSIDELTFTYLNYDIRIRI